MTSTITRDLDRFALAALLAALGYGALRAYWQLAGPPGKLSLVGPDLVTFSGWWGVGLCAAAAAVAAGMLRPRPPRTAILLVVAGLAASIALVASAAMIVLDLIGGIFPGIGIELFPRGAASRAACIGVGVLLALAVRSFQRTSGVDVPGLRRLRSLAIPLDHTPRWAYVAAYVSMGACLTRITAQIVVGTEESPLSTGIAAVLFELCFVLAGTLLPLALVHAWGRVWPRWVLGLAGRRVPRWLVLGPAIAVSALIVTYFGVMLVQMVVERVHGRNPFPPDAQMDLPEAFFWVAVPAYFVWGAALGIAALAFHRRSPSREGGQSPVRGMDRTLSVTSLES